MSLSGAAPPWCLIMQSGGGRGGSRDGTSGMDPLVACDGAPRFHPSVNATHDIEEPWRAGTSNSKDASGQAYSRDGHRGLRCGRRDLGRNGDDDTNVSGTLGNRAVTTEAEDGEGG